MARPSPGAMFDPEVVEELRRQFQAADADGSGEIDAEEACRLFATSCDPHASEEQLRKTIEGLRHQLDTDRSGTISFDEYCFRFGRKYQMERNRRRREAAAKTSSDSPAAGASAAGDAVRAEQALRGMQQAGPQPEAQQPESSSSRRELEEEREAIRCEREALELEKEREALRREREALERERQELRRRGTAGASGDAQAASNDARSSAPPPPPQQQQQPQELAPGARVTLQGLRGAAELNGRTGSVVRFDALAGRYVIELDAGGGQKSLKGENLVLQQSAGRSATGSSAASAATGFAKKVQDAFKQGCAYIQVWLAGYEWWQLALGAGLIVLFLATWVQVSNRYPGSGGSSGSHAGGRSDGAAGGHGSGRGPRPRSHGGGGGGGAGGRRATPEDFGGYDSSWDDGDSYGGSYDRYDSNDGYGYGYGGGGGGLLGYVGSGGGMQWYLVVGGLAFLCWKGIIPVHRMSWFQIYMLWNFLEPLLLGGGGRRGFGGGFGRRRRGFF